MSVIANLVVTLSIASDVPAGLAKAQTEVDAGTARMASAFDNLGVRSSKVFDSIGSAGKKMTTYLTLPIVAAGAAAVKMSADFTESMLRIQTQARGSAQDVATLSKQVLSLSSSAEQGPKALADSLYHLKSVGMDNSDAMKALKTSSDLAAVGGSNLEDTTNALAGAWRSGISGAQDFGIAAATLNGIVGVGNMRMSDLVAAIGTGFLPTAATFGVSLRSVGAALALMTDEGIPADQAATKLRMTMTLMGAPTSKAAAALGQIGINSTALATAMRGPTGLVGAVELLKQHLVDSGLTAVQQSQVLAHAFGGGRTSAGILALITNVDVLKQKYDKINPSLANFNAAVAAQRKTPKAQWDLFMASLQHTAVVVGAELTPMLARLGSTIAHLVDSFTHLSKGTQDMILKGALFVAAIGPVAFIVGKIAKGVELMVSAGQGIGNLVKGFKLLAGAEMEADAAANANPVGAVILAIAAAVATAIAVWMNWDTIVQWVTHHLEIVSGVLVTALGPIGALIAIVLLLSTHWHQVWTDITNWTMDAVHAIGGFFSDIGQWLKDAYVPVQAFGVVFRDVAGAVEAAWGAVVNFVKDHVPWIASALNSAGDLLHSFAKGLGLVHDSADGAADGFTKAGDHLVGMYTSAQNAPGPVGDLTSALKTLSDTTTTATKYLDTWKTLVDSIIGIPTDAFQVQAKLGTSIQAVTDAIVKNGTSFDVWSGKNRTFNAGAAANVTALGDQTKSIMDLATAQAKATGNTQDGITILQQYRMRLVDTFTQAGLTTQQVDGLLQQLGLTDAQFQPIIDAASIQGANQDLTTLNATADNATRTRTLMIQMAFSPQAKAMLSSIMGMVGAGLPVQGTPSPQMQSVLNSFNSQTGQRWGGVTAYADGGVTPAHVTQDQVFKYGEPGTGGEAFVPKLGDPKRSKAILATAASWYGMRLVPMAAGGTTAAAAAGGSPTAPVSQGATDYAKTLTDAGTQTAAFYTTEGKLLATFVAAAVAQWVLLSTTVTVQATAMNASVQAQAAQMLAVFGTDMNDLANVGLSGGSRTGEGVTGGLAAATGPVAAVAQGFTLALANALDVILKGIGQAPIAMATGGPVPGHGNGDTVPAWLTPGEFVVTKDAAKRVGYGQLQALNAQKFAAGGRVLDVPGAVNFAQSYMGTPYAMGPADCSMFQSLIYSHLLGLPPTRYFTTVNFLPGGNAAQLGFQPGLSSIYSIGSEGGANAGGHMAGTLAGTNFEQTPPMARMGPGARGATDPLFGGNIWSLTGTSDVMVVPAPVVMPAVPPVGGGPWLGGTATAAMQYERGKAQAWTDAHTYVAQAISGGDPGAPGGGSGGGGPLRGIAQSLLDARGWGSQMPALDFIISHESGWNPAATNPNGGAFGLGQALPASKIDPYGNRNDPTVQLRWMLDYIGGRYGDPNGAQAFWASHNWYNKGGQVQSYDQGGWLQPGYTLAHNGTGQPERVGGTATMTRDAPLIGEVHVHDEADAELVMRRIQFIARTRRL